MLLQLNINDLAVVRRSECEFHSGMTTITGETGAGKSILLDALKLVLGGRSDTNMIHPNADKTDISATFDVSKLPGAILWLGECDLSVDEPNICLIRRIIHKNGRSKALINGHPATLQQLRALGEYLVQIHGQHQHQTLTKAQEQRRLLDAFGQHDNIVTKVKKSFEEWDKLIHTKQQLSENSDSHHAKLDLLNYQLDELNKFELDEHSVQNLIKEHDKLANAEADIAACQKALNSLEQDNGIENLILSAQKTIKPYLSKHLALKNVYQCLEQANVFVKEAVGELENFSEQLDVDPERVNILSNRLSQLHDIARKHRVEIEKIYEYQQNLETQAQELENISETLAKIDASITLAQKQYKTQADKLTQARSKAAKALSKSVTSSLGNLGLTGSQFTIELKPYEDDKCHANGQETVHYNFSANPGHPPQPLAKVASGGELSRVSLALELVTQNYLSTPTLIFDEVDVGVGGKVGALVGKALHELAKSAQVLCITHLPQVASKANEHILVQKKQNKQSTESILTTLTFDQRVEELARMLGGEDITNEARKNAEVLLVS
jgi:DNA repair protein RecN (Recombination protein N)